MKIRARPVAELIIQSTTPLTPAVSIEIVISKILQSHFSINDSDSADEIAEELLTAVKNELLTVANQAFTSGTICTFELLGTENEYVRGSSVVDGAHSPRESEVRSRRQFTQEIISCLRELNWRDFELTSTAILTRLGCPTPHTSPRRDDGGLDFYGRLDLEGRLDDLLPLGGIDRRLHLWLIGQAKHYPRSDVGPAAVRELVGSVELARTRGAIHDWTGLDFRSFDPVCQLFFTTGTFSNAAQKLLNKSGIVAMDGDQLATFLADCGVGIDSNGFSHKKFQSDLGL